MRAIYGWHLVSAQQGGARMSSRRSAHDMQVTPMQVWPALPSDLRTRIAGLLAQLAVNMVFSLPPSVCTGKEATHVQQTSIAKNRAFPS
jgi:hypothetical protein